MTTLFVIFAFITWGLGLLTWVVYMGHLAAKWDLQNQSIEVDLEQKKLFLAKIGALSGPFSKSFPTDSLTIPPKEIPEKLKELMKSSPNHPEVEEIEATDQIIGVRFEAENYPPGFGDADEE
jgi:hypothetical protein